MAKPSTVPAAVAATANYDVTSGVPAGLIGTPTRVTPPSSHNAYGLTPGATIKSQHWNYTLGFAIDWVRWVAEAQSTLVRSQHLVETTANGKTAVQYLTIGDGNGTALNYDNALTLYADGAKYGITAVNGASNTLQLFKGVTSSTTAGCAYFETTATGKYAVEAIATTGRGVSATATTGTALYGSSTSGSGVYGVASGSAAGVAGDGSSIGVAGTATQSNGTGVRGRTEASATSSAKGVLAEGLSSGVGLRATAVSGNAVIASCTGAEDVVVCLASGTGAALRLDPQSAPATQRAGQIWISDEASNQALARICTNDAGLGSGVDPYVLTGSEPEYRESTFVVGPTNKTANGVYSELASVTLVYYHTVHLVIRANMQIKPNPIGAIPLNSGISVRLKDTTAGTVIATSTVDLATSTGSVVWCLDSDYTVPSTGSRTIKLEVVVGSAASGTIDFINAALHISTKGAVPYY